MTTVQGVLSRLAAMLVTLLEMGGGPESIFYLVVANGNMAAWEVVRAALQADDLVTFRNHWMTLTPKGVEKATRLREVMQKQLQKMEEAATAASNN